MSKTEKLIQKIEYYDKQWQHAKELSDVEICQHELSELAPTLARMLKKAIAQRDSEIKLSAADYGLRGLERTEYINRALALVNAELDKIAEGE